MTPRQNRRAPDPGSGGGPRSPATALELWGGVEYEVRRVLGAGARPGAAEAPYRCPGCDHEITRTTAHVVAWPADRGGIDLRRHWHTACWTARERRGPTSRRPPAAR